MLAASWRMRCSPAAIEDLVHRYARSHGDQSHRDDPQAPAQQLEGLDGVAVMIGSITEPPDHLRVCSR
jgi:hypothetical protein